MEDIEDDYDYPEPSKATPFYEHFMMLWEMRDGFQPDPLKTFDENVKGMIQFGIRRQRIRTIVRIKTEHFNSTGEIL